MIAALLGALFHDDARVVFPERGEPIDAAISRVAPTVAIVDVEYRPQLVGAAAEVIFFGSSEARARHGGDDVRCYVLPADREALRDQVRERLGAR